MLEHAHTKIQLQTKSQEHIHWTKLVRTHQEATKHLREIEAMRTRRTESLADSEMASEDFLTEIQIYEWLDKEAEAEEMEKASSSLLEVVSETKEGKHRERSARRLGQSSGSRSKGSKGSEKDPRGTTSQPTTHGAHCPPECSCRIDIGKLQGQLQTLCRQQDRMADTLMQFMEREKARREKRTSDTSAATSRGTSQGKSGLDMYDREIQTKQPTCTIGTTGSGSETMEAGLDVGKAEGTSTTPSFVPTGYGAFNVEIPSGKSWKTKSIGKSGDGDTRSVASSTSSILSIKTGNSSDSEVKRNRASVKERVRKVKEYTGSKATQAMVKNRITGVPLSTSHTSHTSPANTKSVSFNAATPQQLVAVAASLPTATSHGTTSTVQAVGSGSGNGLGNLDNILNPMVRELRDLHPQSIFKGQPGEFVRWKLDWMTYWADQGLDDKYKVKTLLKCLDEQIRTPYLTLWQKHAASSYPLTYTELMQAIEQDYSTSVEGYYTMMYERMPRLKAVTTIELNNFKKENDRLLSLCQEAGEEIPLQAVKKVLIRKLPSDFQEALSLKQSEKRSREHWLLVTGLSGRMERSKVRQILTDHTKVSLKEVTRYGEDQGWRVQVHDPEDEQQVIDLLHERVRYHGEMLRCKRWQFTYGPEDIFKMLKEKASASRHHDTNVDYWGTPKQPGNQSQVPKKDSRWNKGDTKGIDKVQSKLKMYQ